ncbi:MAG: DUF2147 domain-containing protein [Saprospiraceae bacterium]
MKTIFLKGITLFMLLLFTSFTLLAQNAKDIIGKWKDKDHPDKQIEMYVQGTDKYEAKMINDTRKKSQNGLIIFKNLSWNEAKRIYQGILINPDDGNEFKINIELVNKDTFQFKIKRMFLTKTFQFVRI